VDTSLLDAIVAHLWVPATYAKLLFLFVTAPIWYPLAKIVYGEILPALNAPEDAATRRLPPGEDPFLNIPLASHRARRAQVSAGVARAANRRRMR
jgi:hypothetical protein